jgi:lipid-A-disaccharide synthase-like uncharacterized protein
MREQRSESRTAVPLLFWGVVLIGTLFLAGYVIQQESKLAKSTWVVQDSSVQIR